MLYPSFDFAGFENRRMALKSLQERKIWIVALLLVGLIMREADRLKEGDGERRCAKKGNQDFAIGRGVQNL